MERASGILLPISSLPSKYGIGCFDECAYSFADWLKESGQTYWQILPLGITGFGDSPYQSFSTFAGNPYMISLKDLIADGVIDKEMCDSVDFGTDQGYVDYYKLYNERYRILRIAYNNDSINCEEFRVFEQENSFWLDDYSLFMAIKDKYNGRPFIEWDKELILRDCEFIESAKNSLADTINFHKYIQFKFYSQWKRLKAYANSNGIKIIGDIPIYVAYDSSDVWSNPNLFNLDRNMIPKAVAGCPPDGFSKTGQLWGNPLYNWKYHKGTNYSWWISRLKYALDLYDIVRIDHFRGFESFYAVPYGDDTAVNGKWEKGPGAELFKKSSVIIGSDRIIAEDLGYMTDSVKEMLKECSFPGMKVLQFAFDSRDAGGNNEHLPHLYNRNSVVYTGTHDNQTIVSWFDSITDIERKNVLDYLCTDNNNNIHKKIIALAMRSVSEICIIPVQDWLALDDRTRMNTPSTLGDNWRWRLETLPGSNLASEIKHMTEIFGRA